MLPDLQDTIVAVSSAPGPGARAIIRLSGQAALAVACRLFTTSSALSAERRGLYEGLLHLPGVASPLPADLYYWPAPKTYTGQTVVELHTLSCPPLVDLAVAQLLGAGARAAQAGEFTLRAFLAGKLDLPRAEAVLGVIEAGTRDQLKEALAQLAGGVAQPLRDLRVELLDLLAEVEAGLDFSEEDIRFIDQQALLNRLTKGMALLTLSLRQMDQRAVADRPFRAVLAGPPNVGKSSLFNALAGAAAALVSAEPGTTRDYLTRRLEIDGVTVEVVDTAGRAEAADTIEEAAQLLGREQAAQADLVLLCRDSTAEQEPAGLASAQGGPPVVEVWTKCDVGTPPAGTPATSAATGAGLNALRSLLAERARAHQRPPLAPSLSRCRHHVEAALSQLRQAHHVALFEEPPELLALELRGALDELGEMVGAVYTDDLLDRIFSRFCIGK
ncbi:MAG TPA: tRNA modification GTPase [Gemmataceae bacterium]|jgi:tRNA modification GTPase|nr:tRNA modification GTPase [Gemmataceae bacterium]